MIQVGKYLQVEPGILEPLSGSAEPQLGPGAIYHSFLCKIPRNSEIK
jgi:hypothetical protein